MQLILLLAIVVESIVLLFLTLFGKLTKKVFVVISLLTAIMCGAAAVISYNPGEPIDRSEKIRSSVYMAVSLLEQNRPEDALTALGQISETEGSEYGAEILRVVAFNQVKDYAAVKVLITESQGKGVLDFSGTNVTSDELTTVQVKEYLDATRSLLAFTDEEVQRFDAEYAIRYANADGNSSSDPALKIYAAVLQGDFDGAYQIALESADNGSVVDDILISEMYIRNFDQRFLAENDAAFDALLTELTRTEIEVYKNAAEFGVDSKEYQRIHGEYQLALSEWNRENSRRAINYLLLSEAEGTPFELAYMLQMAKLYASYNDKEQADACLDVIFADLSSDPNQWLGTDVFLLREAYLNGADSIHKPEFDSQYCRLMNNLYQGALEEDTLGDFYSYLRVYLKGTSGGIYIGVPDISDFPTVRVTVSTSGDVELSSDVLQLSDTNEHVVSYVMQEGDKREIDYGLMYWLTELGNRELNKFNVRKTMNAFGLDSMGPLTSYPSLYAGFIGAADSYRNREKEDLILFHDGQQGTYPNGMPGVLNRLISDGISINVAGFPGCDEDLMRHLAYQTGGSYFPIASIDELRIIKEELTGEYDHTYTITYQVVNSELSERSIGIAVDGTSLQSRRQYSTDPSVTRYSIVDDKQISDFFRQIGGTLGGT